MKRFFFFLIFTSLINIIPLIPSLLLLSQESMSTCRFAQRVALIKNDALLNEELDPALVSLTLSFALILFL